MKEPNKERRTLSVRLHADDFETMQHRARATNRSVSDFARVLLALGLETARDDPTIVSRIRTGSRRPNM
jgi:hypothetical protein